MAGDTSHVRYESMDGHENAAFLKPGLVNGSEEEATSSNSSLPLDDPETRLRTVRTYGAARSETGLSVRETAKLSLEFCLLWVSLSDCRSYKRSAILTYYF